ncbi:MAG: cytochrome C [Pseudomonadota bacterium]
MNAVKSGFLHIGCWLLSGLSAAVQALPDGPGQQEVTAICSACHETRLIERSSGYSQGDWRALISTMIELPPETEAVITGYLAEHFPPNDRRTPTLIAGSVEIDFQSWLVPTLGQRSRDPVEAPDGSIWWVGQGLDIVGRIDPKTGAMREYPTAVGAKPHSVTPDKDGAMWYLGNKNGTVGKLDPETGDIVEYPMPDPEARDPHTGEFDAQGRFWFTLQHSNRVGRLDPASGDIQLIELDRPRSRPYGIKIDRAGDVWVACNGGPCLYHLDGKSMAATRIDLPNQESHVRRLDIAADGIIWYVNSGAGRLGRYDPDTGVIREWPSPSGPKSHPYAILIVDGAIWYNESGMRPDALVRFDPEDETFQSWPIPSSGFYAGILRHMRAAENGDLLIHQSATNHIIRVSVSEASGDD